MQDYAYYNGVITPYDSATVPLSDRSLFFADSVYDVILGTRGIPYQADEHVSRLIDNAQRIGLAKLPEKAKIIDEIHTLIEISDAENFIAYVQLSATGRRRAHLRDEDRANLLITLTKAKIPNELEFIDAITLPDTRHRICDIKTTNLLISILSVEKAKERSADIAIYERDEEITECSYANLVFCKAGTLVFHPTDSDILPGITQRNLMLACKELGIPYEIRRANVNELFDADFVLTTSTTKLLKVVRSINGKRLDFSRLELAWCLFKKLLSNLMSN